MKLRLIQQGNNVKITDENGNLIEGVMSVNYEATMNGVKLFIELGRFEVDIECDDPIIVYVDKDKK